MSADIWLEDKEGVKLEWDYQQSGMQNVANVSWGNNFNLTYNLTPMLRKAGMPPWKEFMGISAAVAGDIWDKVVIEMVSRPDKYIPLNPENGWGSYDQAIEVLSALVTACRANPYAVIGGWL